MNWGHLTLVTSPLLEVCNSTIAFMRMIWNKMQGMKMSFLPNFILLNNSLQTLGTSKCAKAHFHAWGKSSGFPLRDSSIINDVHVEGYYKYLGLDQCDEMLHSKMKKKVEKEYLYRCREILLSELILNSKNIKIQALNYVCSSSITVWLWYFILDWGWSV